MTVRIPVRIAVLAHKFSRPFPESRFPAPRWMEYVLRSVPALRSGDPETALQLPVACAGLVAVRQRIEAANDSQRVLGNCGFNPQFFSSPNDHSIENRT